jgi:hypothetical protein
MKSYFCLISLCYLMMSTEAFSQFSVQTPYANPAADEPYVDPVATADKPLTYQELAYPAIRLSQKLAQYLFLDGKRNLLNCPVLFDNSWDYPSGSSLALCDDAQLACLRYGLIIEAIKKASGKYLRELEKTLILSKAEVALRLRGCHLGLLETMTGMSIEEAAGYPTDTYGSKGPYGPVAQ